MRVIAEKALLIKADRQHKLFELPVIQDKICGPYKTSIRRSKYLYDLPIKPLTDPNIATRQKATRM